MSATDQGLRPLHPVDQLTTSELAGYRASLEQGLAVVTEDATTRAQLQRRLDAVLAEQDERARIRQANGAS